MKVSNVEETVGGDGQPRWVVSFTKQDGSPAKNQLVESTKPTEAIGDDLPVVLVKPTDAPWYYKRKVVTASGTQQVRSQGKSYKADPEKLDDIMIMSAWKIADEQIRHHIVPAGKVDVGLIGQVASEIFASMVIMRPKRTGTSQ